MKKISSFIAALALSALLFNACKKDERPADGTVNTFAALYVVKNAYKGSDVQLNASALNGATQTGGVVISNLTGNNLPKGSLIIQNSSRGQVRGLLIELGDAASNYLPGDSLLINIEGSTLSKVSGSLQLKGITAANITKVSSDNVSMAKTVALGALLGNFELYENTLLKVTADAKPVPQPGETYAGNKMLDDGSGSAIALYTSAEATFASNSLPASATYTVIPLYGDETGNYGTTPQLRLRTAADVENASGPIYPNWPESFESPDQSIKASYNMNTAEVPDNSINLKTGSWKLYQSILAATAGRDRINAPGLQSIRMQQNLKESAFLQMNFDLPNGASKVTFWAGAYHTDAVSTLRLEYSLDQGLTWLAAGPDIQCQSGASRQETFLLDIKGKVRFRINKLGLGTTSVPNILNGRLCIEDIAIYSN